MIRLPIRINWGLKIFLEGGITVNVGRSIGHSKRIMKSLYPIGGNYNIDNCKNRDRKIIKTKIFYYFNYFVLIK